MEGDAVGSFCDITGASHVVAGHLLEMAGGQLETAIMLYFENPELQASLETAPRTPRPAVPASSRRRQPIGREDASGVILLDDSDDDDDTLDNIDVGSDINAATHAARNAQEEEDAAMAQRVQQELYADAPNDPDRVRSPIARRTEALVAPDPAWDGEDLMDDATYVDNMRHRAFIEAMRQRRGLQHQNLNPFNQNIWDYVPGTGETAEARGPQHPVIIPSSLDIQNIPPILAGPPTVEPPQNISRAQRLAELFRPPYSIISSLSWDMAREKGKQDKKWIMVNLQDMGNFKCQALNRDIWRDEDVRELVQEHFIFLQYSLNDPGAQQYINFYFQHHSHEDPNNYPHVSVIDPRTGEQLETWSDGLSSPAKFCEELLNFLNRYSLSTNSKNPVGPSRAGVQRAPTIDVDRMTEEEMLEMAMQNSLEAAGGAGDCIVSGIPTGSVSAPVLDQSSIRRAATDDAFQVKAKTTLSSKTADGSASGASSESETSPEIVSTFAGISSTHPHTEPTDEAALTTRIQFRHSTGRVIRRFGLAEPVRHIYEWLKSGGLQGIFGADAEAGAEFELKRMPQGLDLISQLDTTIEQAGLKQGTVMIELATD